MKDWTQVNRKFFSILHVSSRGKKKGYVLNILEACNLYPAYGIPKLIGKCLITVDWCDNLLMHDLL